MSRNAVKWLTGFAAACVVFVPAAAQGQAHSIGTNDLWRGREAMAQREAEQRSEQLEVEAGQRAGIDQGVDWLSLGMDIANSARDFGESFTNLTPDDAQFQPDYNPPGMPEVPISCGEDAECQECYAKAQHELNFLRVQFEKLRAIYDATNKMADNAIKFGDDVSSIHGVMGLAWQTQKRGIQQSVAHLGQTYDAKYTDLLAALERQLKVLADCEAKHFNTPDWYNRFGFIYYQFMAARYKR